MGRLKGAVITDRDRILISFLGIARYASTAQLHRLAAEGRDISVVYRRMRRLSAQVRRNGEAPCVRKLEFRRAEGTAVTVWTLTPFGRTVAESLVPYMKAPAKADVGSQFLFHTLMLNDVLLELVLGLRTSSTSPMSDLPFRWFCENDEVLGFSMFRKETGQARPAVLKPDAILELPESRRRLFLEAETGAHSIATADPLAHGAVLRKVERYARFFSAVAPGAGRSTFYGQAFTDGFVPELVILVHSDKRRAKVEAAIREWRGGNGLHPHGPRVVTFMEAPTVLTPVRGHTRDESASGIREPEAEVVRRLRDSYNAIAHAFNSAQRAVAEHNLRCTQPITLPPVPIAQLKALRDLIRDEGSTPRPGAEATNFKFVGSGL